MSAEYYPVSYLISGDIAKKDFISICKLYEEEDIDINVIALKKTISDTVEHTMSGNIKLFTVDSRKENYIQETINICKNNSALIEVSSMDAAYGSIDGLDEILDGNYNYLTETVQDDATYYNYYLSKYKDFYKKLPLSIPPDKYSNFNGFYNYLHLGISLIDGQFNIKLSTIEEYSKLDISIIKMKQELESLTKLETLLKPVKIIN